MFFMFFSLFLLSKAENIDFNASILSPLIVTHNNRNVGQYSIRGSSLPSKRFLRLTTNIITDDYGGFCNVLRNRYSDFSVRYSISGIRKGKNIWRINSFVYSDELCPENNKKMNGFAIKYEDFGNSNNVTVSYSFNQQKNSTFLCSFTPQSPTASYLSLISVNSSFITVKTQSSGKENDSEFETCGTFPNSLNFTKGYMSFFSTSIGEVENNDLYYFLVFNQSSTSDPESEESRLVEEMKNRRILSKPPFRRQSKQYKELRHPISTFYKKQKDFENDILNGNNRTTILTRAFEEINELIDAAFNGMIIEELHQFIAETVDQKIEIANKKLENCGNTINEFRNDFKDIYVSTVSLLKGIQNEMRNNLIQTDNEMRRTISHIFSENNNKFYRNKISDIQITKEERKQNFLLNKILSIICAFELMFYAIFIIYKRKQTSNFKKAY